MKLKSIFMLCAISLSSAAMAGSYQYGKVSELITEGDRVTFQLDTANGVDIRDESCNGATLNFVIDFNSKATAQIMYQTALESKRDGINIGVNGAGNCGPGGEFEQVDTIAR
ncbi:hypothetical protein [Thalassomonas viridans]|nr:hypothetical protein [Thalassomonas viridans]